MVCVKESYNDVLRYIWNFFVILIAIRCIKSEECVLVSKIYEDAGKIRKDKCYGVCNFSTTKVKKAKNIIGMGPSEAGSK